MRPQRIPTVVETKLTTTFSIELRAADIRALTNAPSDARVLQYNDIAYQYEDMDFREEGETVKVVWTEETTSREEKEKPEDKE